MMENSIRVLKPSVNAGLTLPHLGHFTFVEGQWQDVTVIPLSQDPSFAPFFAELGPLPLHKKAPSGDMRKRKGRAL